MLNTSLRAMLVALVCFAASAASPPAAQAAKRSTTCADRLCKRDRAAAPSCWRFKAQQRVSRCFIRRAAAHYRQSTSHALHIAWRESRYQYRVVNPSSGTAGLFQFASATWRSTPYRRYSPRNPRWASLAAMWMWKHGGLYHWRL